MNIYREIELYSSTGKNDVFDKIIKFCKDNNKWLYSKKSTKIIQDGLVDEIGTVIEYDNKYKFSFIEKSDKKIYLTNIIPLETDQLSTSKYNELAMVFYENFINWKKENDVKISIKKSKTELELKDIISAKKPREDFETFLSNFPLSMHPCDINRLDQFIISSVIFPRKEINWGHLAEYLRSKLSWPEDSINKCMNRIEIGRSILKKYRVNDRNKIII